MGCIVCEPNSCMPCGLRRVERALPVGRCTPAAQEKGLRRGLFAGRPFVWGDEIFLAHWMSHARGVERMAISAVDEAAGLVRLVHVLGPLPREAAPAQRGARQGHDSLRACLTSLVRGSTDTGSKDWGLVADHGQLLAFPALLPCTVVLAFGAADASARVASRACFADAAEAIKQATGAHSARLLHTCSMCSGDCTSTCSGHVHICSDMLVT